MYLATFEEQNDHAQLGVQTEVQLPSVTENDLQEEF